MRAHKLKTTTKNVRISNAVAPAIGQTLVVTDDTGNEIVAGWGNPGAITTTAIAIAATLTDSTGKSGTHDDTLAATTVPTITATNPTAPAAYAAVVNMTDPVAKAEGEAVSAALAALRAEVATYETAISALVVDVAAILTLLGVMTQNQSDVGQKVIELVAQFNQLRADVAA